MVILVNSSFHNTGCSVLTYMLAKAYGNIVNTPVLFMSLDSADFYKYCIKIDDSWSSQPVTMVINKTKGKGSFKPFCFKLEETLYYYHASASSLSSSKGVSEIESLLERASSDFGLVIVDIDSKSNGFAHLSHLADIIVIGLSNDTLSIAKSSVAINNIKETFTSTHGLELKAKILYVLNKYDTSVTIPATAKTLKTLASNVYILQNSVELARAKNERRLDEFVADMLQPKQTNPNIVKLKIQLFKILNVIKKG